MHAIHTTRDEAERALQLLHLGLTRKEASERLGINVGRVASALFNYRHFPVEFSLMHLSIDDIRKLMRMNLDNLQPR